MPEQDVSLDQSLNKVLGIALRRRWWVLITAAVVTVSTCVAASFLLPDRYESKATILVVRQDVPDRYVTPIRPLMLGKNF